MGNHATGPWGLCRSETGPWAVFDTSGNWLAVTTKKQWPTEDLANARLIAAAPDLLEFVDRVARQFSDAVHAGSVESRFRDDAIALIAKATTP